MWKRWLLTEASEGRGIRACWRWNRRVLTGCEVLVLAWSSGSLPWSAGDRHAPEVSRKMPRGSFAGQQGLGFSFQSHINRQSTSSYRCSYPHLTESHRRGHPSAPSAGAAGPGVQDRGLQDLSGPHRAGLRSPGGRSPAAVLQQSAR